jgi:hypothetical protein
LCTFNRHYLRKFHVCCSSGLFHNRHTWKTGHIFLINIVAAISALHCDVERSAGSLALNNRSEVICLVSGAICFCLAMSSGTIAPVGFWSSGSMRVHYVQKTGGGHELYFSNSKMNIKTEMPRFDVIQF